MVSPGRLGRYNLRGELGAGAMGTVYDGWDPELARRVAIKVIRGPRVDRQALERFRREAQTLARLSHPNSVGIHDMGAENGTPYIVMDFVEGATLADEIAKGIARPLSEKVRLAAQVCDALALANSAGIVHRDVKPGNILIGIDGNARLADFGLVRLQDSSLTGTSNVVGTPAYLAPEAFSGEELDSRADVYGMAASIFEWVSGARPYQSEQLATLMAQILHQDAPDIREKWPGCPPGLAECLGRGLARDRSARYQSAREFGEALRAVDLSEAPSEAINLTVILEAPPVKVSSRQSRSRIAAAAVVLVILLGVAMLARWPGSTPSAKPALVAAEPVAKAIDIPAMLPTAGAREPRKTPPAPRSASRLDPPRVEAQLLDVAAEDDGAEPPPPALPIGTKVMVAIRSELRTDRAVPGQGFDAVLADALFWSGHQVAPAEARVQGIVDTVVAGSGDRPASLQLSLTSIDIDGQPVRVRTARYEAIAPPPTGNSRGLVLVVGIIGGAAIGATIGGAKGAVAGAAAGAQLDLAAARGSEYAFGNRLTFKLAEPLRFRPSTQ